MKVSTANLTIGLIDRMKRLGYSVEVDADYEFANVYKEHTDDPVPQDEPALA